MAKKFNIDKYLDQRKCEPFLFQDAFDLKSFAVVDDVNAKLESVVSPVVVLDGTAAVTMASQRPLITSDALNAIEAGKEPPAIGASRKAIHALKIGDEVEIIDPPLLPKSIGASPLLEIIGDGGMGFERDTPASHLVTQSAITLVPKTMMTDLSVENRGNFFGLPKFPTTKTHGIKTKNGSELDIRVWEASIRALNHGLQIYALHDFDFEDQEQIKRGLTSYLASEFLLGMILMCLKNGDKMRLFSESSMQLDFVVREDQIPMDHEHEVKGWQIKAVHHEMTSVTVELFEGMQVTATLDITGHKKNLSRGEYSRFRKLVWNSAIYSGGDDIVKMMYAGNRCLMKSMMRSAVNKYLDENRSTLIVSWRNPGAALTSDLGYTNEGSLAILESVAAGFEKSYDTLTEELSVELEIDLDEVHKAVAVISHRTKDAIGSNAYSAYNDIVIIGEPYKPAIAVNIDKSWQGNQLTAKNDMLAALLQSIGRGVIRQGSASSPRLQNVFLFDIGDDLLLDIQDYFTLVTDVVDGYESIAKKYDKLARSMLDFLMKRLNEANDDFIIGLQFLTEFPMSRTMTEIVVHSEDVKRFEGYPLEKMSENLRKHVPDFPRIKIQDDIRLVTGTPYKEETLEKVWHSIVMHSITKQLWTFRHIRKSFETISNLRTSLTGIE